MVVLNRKRAYHDDPMWILNKACENATGQSLPSGFYLNNEWKWIELDGKKEWIRRPTLEDYASKTSNPLQTIHYFGLETKIMRANLHQELVGLFHKTYRNYRTAHLKYYYLEAWYRVCKDHNATGGMKPLYIPELPDDTTFYEWWFMNRDTYKSVLFLKRTSPLYLGIAKREREWTINAIQRHLTNNLVLCCDNDEMMEVLNNPSAPRGRGGRGINLPCLVRHREHIYCGCVKKISSPTAAQTMSYPDITKTRYKKNVIGWMENNHEFKAFAYDAIVPALIPMMDWEVNEGGDGDNYNQRAAKGLFKTIKDSGLVQYKSKPASHSIIHNQILDGVKLRCRVRRGNGTYYQPWESAIQKTRHSPTPYVCANGKIKTGKKNWSIWFWRNALKISAMDDVSNDKDSPNNGGWETLGGQTKRVSRKGMWDLIKEESGLMSEDENYYKRRDYEKNFKGMMVEEAIKFL